jgi:hypothetical protein
MTKQGFVTAIFCAGAAIGLTTPAQADIIPAPIPSYDGIGYDFTTPQTTPAAFTTIGTFSFTIPTGSPVTGIVVSGSFGNNDSPTTALADFFVNYTGVGSPVEVASCDNPMADCFSNTNGPTAWTYTFTSADLANVAAQIAKGTLDFSFTMDQPPFTQTGLDWTVYAGQTSIDLQVATPEPFTVLMCFSGLSGIAVLRRFRKL